MAQRRIKLIWDFRGPDAGATARHHAKHLKEFIVREVLEPDITGYSDYSDNHSIAYMVVAEANMEKVRDSLVPHRGEVYDD